MGGAAVIRNDEGNEMLRALFALSSFANAFGGILLLLLVAIGVTAYSGERFPVIAIAVGGVLLVQGIFSAGYVQDWWSAWDLTASGALLAGQLISGCVGLATIAYAILYVPRASNGGVEPAPFFSGAMIAVNALLALILLWTSGALTPTRARAAT
jgi:hypothetical protein